MRRHTTLLLAILAIGASLLGSPPEAAGQVAPLNHTTGGAGASVSGLDNPAGPIPLALPLEGHGIPIPLVVAPTGRPEVGEAGVGWGIAPAYVTRNTGVAHRRPRYITSQPGPLASATGEVTVDVGGQHLVMFPVDGAGHYRAVFDQQAYLLTEATDGWDLSDGQGRTFHFERLTYATDPTLEDSSRWYLRSISASTGQQVRLTYNLTPRALGGSLTVLEVQLTSIAYNTASMVACAKHEVRLEWGNPLGELGRPELVGQPLATTADAGVLHVRTEVVTAIEVRAQGASCGTGQRLSRYALRYMLDRDAALPRLVKVDVAGRDGTPEGAQNRPVARYWYGSTKMTVPTGPKAVYFGAAPDLAVPSAGPYLEAPGLGRAGAVDTKATLTDFDGDGILDFVTSTNWWRGIRGQAFAAQQATAMPSGLVGALDRTQHDLDRSHVAYGPRVSDTGTRTTSRENTYAMVVDFNGDGRQDFLDAVTVPGTWQLSLNEPTGWRTITLDVSGVVSQLHEGGHDDLVANVPIARSTTGQTYQADVCQLVTPAFASPTGQEVIKPCPTTTPDGKPTPVVVHLKGTQRTRVEWKLADVNGDGYPDLVASKNPSANRALACSTGETLYYNDAFGSAPLPNYQFYRSWCLAAASFGFTRLDVAQHAMVPADTTELWVFYNRAGAALGQTTVAPFAGWTRLEASTSSAVEDWDEQPSPDGPQGRLEGTLLYTGLLPSGQGAQRAGLIDLNGDGLLDRVTPGRVALGTGNAFIGNFADRYDTWLRTYGSDRAEVCEATPAPAGTTPYGVTHDRGYVDINGDGLPDYITRTTIDGVYGPAVRLNTSAGLAAPTPLLGLPADFALSRASGTCASPTETIAGLYDLDGDGSFEYVAKDPATSTLHRWPIVNLSSGVGALDAGRLTETSDGNGAVTHYRYANAKLDARTVHQLPASEVVLASTWTTGQSGATLSEPTRYAYGGARVWFDAITDRWGFPGYDRVVSTRGTPINSSTVRGSGSVTETWRPQDLATNLERNALVGRPRRTTTLEGDFPVDPGVWLDGAVDLWSDTRWTGQIDQTFGTSTLAAPGYASAVDCATAAQPVGAALAYINSDGDYDHRCKLSVATYAKDVLTREGRHAAPSTSHVETRIRILSADTFGRPTLVQDDGDTARTDDDRCIVTAWPIYDVNRVLDAPTSRRELAPNAAGCATATAILSGMRWRYDGVAEGYVTRGQPTATIIERYDLSTNQKLEEFVSETRSYGVGGVVLDSTIDVGGKQRITRPLAWDPWRLVPTSVEVTTSDAVAPERATYAYDPNTLSLTETTGPNGVKTRHRYDGFGRLALESVVDPDTSQELAQRLRTYSGEPTATATGPFADPWNGWLGDSMDPQGRRLLLRTWHERVSPPSTTTPPASKPAAETWQTVTLDDLGRVRTTIDELGADYGGARLVTVDRTYDSLGRLRYAAAPYAVGATAAYGTTFTYLGDGRPLCQVSGRGLQTAVTTSTADARFAACRSEMFTAGQRIVTSKDADDSDPASANAGAADVAIVDALGRVRQQLRSRAGTNLEKTNLGYDRLGHPISVNRIQNPMAFTQVPTSWVADVDSLGQVLRYRESGTAERTYSYDHGGNLIEVRWQDGSVARAIRNQFDGLGRPTRSATLANQVEDFMSVATYFYDVGSGESFHRDTGRAIGQLTHAHTPAQSVYYGYDSLGRTSFTSWQDDAGHRVERRVASRFDGAPATITLGLPDAAYATEVASYTYDSAQRPLAVRWTDPALPSGVEVYRALARDVRGRLRAARYGNGVEDRYAYRDADRDELTRRTLTTAAGSLTSNFGYDATLRITSRTDLQTFGAARNESALYTYDAARRLSSTRVTDPGITGYKVNDAYLYDGLGNLINLADGVGTRSFTATVDGADADRLCRVNDAVYTSTACSFTYNALGAITSSRLDALRRRDTTYDGYGRATSVRASLFGFPGATATYRYDPFGDVAQLDMVNSSDDRHDVRFGDAAGLSTWRVGGTPTALYERTIALPDGGRLTKRGTGSTATFLYAHGDADGSAIVTDGAGQVTQQTIHRPYGEVRTRIGAPGALTARQQLWNRGDGLDDLGIEQIGARIYEPRTGRFMSRDPLKNLASAGLANPYAFTGSDPINRADPTGLGTEGDAQNASSAYGTVAASLFYLTQLFADGDQEAPEPTPPDQLRSVRALVAGAEWAEVIAEHKGVEIGLGTMVTPLKVAVIGSDALTFALHPSWDHADELAESIGGPFYFVPRKTFGVGFVVSRWVFGSDARDRRRGHLADFKTAMGYEFWGKAKAYQGKLRGWAARALVGGTSLNPPRIGLTPSADRRRLEIQGEIDRLAFEMLEDGPLVVDGGTGSPSGISGWSTSAEVQSLWVQWEQVTLSPGNWAADWELVACQGVDSSFCSLAIDQWLSRDDAGLVSRPLN